MPETSDISAQKKKRKWPRRLFFSAILLIILGVLINGPVARWAAGYGLNKALEAQGMSGSADISGSLASGFKITNIDYSGKLGIQKLKINSLSTNYTILKIIKSNIDSVSLTDAEIILDLAKFPASEKTDETSDANIRETITNIHKWVSNPKISITNLDLTILKEDELQARFTLGELDHPAKSNNFKLTNFVAQDASERTTPAQTTNITCTAETATIDRFEVLPDLTFVDVNLNWSSHVKGSGILNFIDSSLNISADKTISAKLKSGTLTSEEIKKRFNIDLPISYEIDALDIEIDNWKNQPLPTWNITGNLRAKSFTFEEYNLTTTTLTLNQIDNNFNLNINSNLNKTPLILGLKGNWNNPSDPEWWSDLTADYTIESPQLGKLTELWWQAPNGLNLAPATINTKGNIILKENELTNATCQTIIANIQANKTTIPDLHLSANFSPNKPFTAKLSSPQRLSLDASYDLNTSDYQANLSISEENTNWINQIASIFEAQVTLKSPLNLSWSGSGNADTTKPQRGKLNTQELQITLPDTPSFNITAETEYNWPESINIKSLIVKESDWVASTSLSWDGKTINLPAFSLLHDKEKVASISGSIPFTAEINSAKTFLAQQTPINLSIKTSPLDLPQIEKWSNLKAIQNITGTTEIDIEISGTPHKPSLAGKFEASKIKGISDSNIQPIDIKFDFLTKDRRLNTTGTIFEGNTNRLTLDASIPYEPDTWINDPNFVKKILDTPPVSLDINIKSLPIKRFTNLLPENLKNISGSLNGEISVSGTPKTPVLKGNLSAENIQGFADAEVAPLNITLGFLTENENLNINTRILEGGNNRLSFNSNLPYNPEKWIEDPKYLEKFLNTAELSADLKINTLPLNRFKSFAPQLTKLEGSISGTGTLSGTINDPKYQVNIEANVPLIKLNISEIDEVRDTKLNAKFTQDQIVTTKLVSQINGGQFQADGSINLTDIQNPEFDIKLKTNYALVHRDDLMSIRANTDLNLKGSLEDAVISGTIGLAESLFYKDIELIPVGVPSSAAAEVQLPTADAENLDELPIPEPFSKWKLDLKIQTDDPVLIRGNVAKGNISGSIKVGGTLKNPAPNGTLYLNEIRAKLPFSILEIPKGEIRFNPKDALNPTLEIRGKSTIGSYDVSLFVYGPATNPKTAFTSYPPLPESEVMTLLGTGTTTSGLEDRDVAAFKAFQIFLLKLKQNAEKPGGNKLFSKLLSGVESLNLKVGEKDQFTGRKFSSSTIEIDKRWHFTAQFDGQQNTRGLIVYVIRFR